MHPRNHRNPQPNDRLHHPAALRKQSLVSRRPSPPNLLQIMPRAERRPRPSNHHNAHRIIPPDRRQGASSSAVISGTDKALRAAGRFNVNQATPSWSWRSSNAVWSVITRFPSRSRHPNLARGGAKMSENRQVLLRERPVGIPQAHQFEVVTTPMPEPGPGQVLIRNAFLSVEPAMRGWVNDAPNYLPPVPVGAVMRSFAVGRVERSNTKACKHGDVVTGMFGWQEWAAVPASAIERIVDDGLPISTALGVLGLNGVTAYFGLLDVGEPRPGDTVVVSTAAGSVGSCVGQIAKIAGCRTVGITGGPAKSRPMRQHLRLRRRHRLPRPRFRGPTRRRMPGRSRRLFRQHRRRRQRRGPEAARPPRPRRHLRHRLRLRLVAAAHGPADRTHRPGQTRPHPGDSRLRLQAPLPPKP